MEPVAFNIRFSSYFKFGKPPFLQLLPIPRPQLRDINDINLWEIQKKTFQTHLIPLPVLHHAKGFTCFVFTDLIFDLFDQPPRWVFHRSTPIGQSRGGSWDSTKTQPLICHKWKQCEKPTIFLRVSKKMSPKSFLDSEVNWSNYPWIGKITVKKVWTLKNPPSVFPLKLLQLPNTVLKTRGFFTSNLAHHHIGAGDFKAFEWNIRQFGWYLPGSLLNPK